MEKSAFESVTSIDWATIWSKVRPETQYSAECDDAEGYLNVIVSREGDVFLTIDRGANQAGMHPSFRSRTHGGGGHKEKIRQALLILAMAIIEDEETNNQPSEPSSHPRD